MSFGINILFEQDGSSYVPLPNFDDGNVHDYVKEITLVRNSVPINTLLNTQKEEAMTNLRKVICEKNKAAFESLTTNYISDLSNLFKPEFEFNNIDDEHEKCCNKFYSHRSETLDLSNWNSQHVQNMENAFSGLKGIRYLDISTWGLSALTNSKDAFKDSSIEFIWCRNIDAMQKLIEKSDGTISKSDYTICLRYL